MIWSMIFDLNEARRLVVGRRIVDVEPGTDQAFAAVVLDDGTVVRSSCDDSGSWLEVESSE